MSKKDYIENDIPNVSKNEKLYVKYIKVFENKKFLSKLDAVKIMRYDVRWESPYVILGDNDPKSIHVENTKIMIKPKCFKWITLYHHENKCITVDTGIIGACNSYYMDGDIICNRMISKSVVDEIMSMIQYDYKALVYLKKYLERIKFYNKIDKVDDLIRKTL